MRSENAYGSIIVVSEIRKAFLASETLQTHEAFIDMLWEWGVGAL